MSTRLLRATDLPASLWRADQDLLLLPDVLSAGYRYVLTSRGLLPSALAGDAEDGPVGGIKDEDTNRHFATRFSGSTARVQLAALDPKDALRNASDLFVRAFSGGKVGLLDIPCGAGAGTAALLGCVAELRVSKVLPREPLEVFLLGGDISSYAQGFAGSMLGNMRGTLEREGIWVREKWVPWDVLSAERTTTLLHAWMEWARDCREYFVVMANFSGFLQSRGKLDEAKRQLDEVLRWAAERRSTVVWIEPQTNAATKGLIPRILNWFGLKLPSRYKGTWRAGTSVGTADSLAQHPLRPDYRYPARVNLIRLEATDP